MADIQRSRPSLRRRILGAFEPKPLALASPTSSSLHGRLRKKRKGALSPALASPPLSPQQRDASPQRFGASHARSLSGDGAWGASTSSRSSSELHTPSSDHRGGGWDSPASSRSSLHRDGPQSRGHGHGGHAVGFGLGLGAQAHATRRTAPLHTQSPDVPFPSFHDPEIRPHSSSDYYRQHSPSTDSLPQLHAGTGHTRCFSQPTEPLRAYGLALRQHHHQPSTLSLRSVDLNRDLPPLPLDQDKSCPPLPASSTSTDADETSSDDDVLLNEFLLAPGTFSRVVGMEEDEEDDEDSHLPLAYHSSETCMDICCKPAHDGFPGFELAALHTGPGLVSRRNSLPAYVDGSSKLRSVEATNLTRDNITPCDENTPQISPESAVFFARSPGAAPLAGRGKLTPALREAALEDGLRQSFLARAASLAKGSSAFNLKNLRTPSLRRSPRPPRIDEVVV